MASSENETLDIDFVVSCLQSYVHRTLQLVRYTRTGIVIFVLFSLMLSQRFPNAPLRRCTMLFMSAI